jgi:hypothetical protein
MLLVCPPRIKSRTPEYPYAPLTRAPALCSCEICFERRMRDFDRPQSEGVLSRFPNSRCCSPNDDLRHKALDILGPTQVGFRTEQCGGSGSNSEPQCNVEIFFLRETASQRANKTISGAYHTRRLDRETVNIEHSVIRNEHRASRSQSVQISVGSGCRSARLKH